MGRDALTLTPNIAWGWEVDEAGNTLLYIRGADGARCSVVLTAQEARDFIAQWRRLDWDRDTVDRQARLNVPGLGV